MDRAKLLLSLTLSCSVLYKVQLQFVTSPTRETLLDGGAGISSVQVLDAAMVTEELLSGLAPGTLYNCFLIPVGVGCLDSMYVKASAVLGMYGIYARWERYAVGGLATATAGNLQLHWGSPISGDDTGDVVTGNFEKFTFATGSAPPPPQPSPPPPPLNVQLLMDLDLEGLTAAALEEREGCFLNALARTLEVAEEEMVLLETAEGASSLNGRFSAGMVGLPKAEDARDKLQLREATGELLENLQLCGDDLVAVTLNSQELQYAYPPPELPSSGVCVLQRRRKMVMDGEIEMLKSEALMDEHEPTDDGNDPVDKKRRERAAQEGAAYEFEFDLVQRKGAAATGHSQGPPPAEDDKDELDDVMSMLNISGTAAQKQEAHLKYHNRGEAAQPSMQELMEESFGRPVPTAPAAAVKAPSHAETPPEPKLQAKPATPEAKGFLSDHPLARLLEGSTYGAQGGDPAAGSAIKSFVAGASLDDWLGGTSSTFGHSSLDQWLPNESPKPPAASAVSQAAAPESADAGAQDAVERVSSLEEFTVAKEYTSTFHITYAQNQLDALGGQI
eukprot:gene2459-3194_t